MRSTHFQNQLIELIINSEFERIPRVEIESEYLD